MMFTARNLSRISLVFVVTFLMQLFTTPMLDSIVFGTSSVSAQGEMVDPEKSVVIRDLSVVEDPNRTFNPCTGAGTPMGKWTFGYLMTQLANPSRTGLDPAKFTRSWLWTFANDQVVNGDIVPNRRSGMLQLILRPWEIVSGGPINSPLDLSKAPFRLLAIVNRVDLRNNQVLGGQGAGEARLIFGAVDLNNDCQPLQFTVNFEYRINRSSCESIRDWAIQWQNLSQLEIGSEVYNAALE